VKANREEKIYILHYESEHCLGCHMKLIITASCYAHDYMKKQHFFWTDGKSFGLIFIRALVGSGFSDVRTVYVMFTWAHFLSSLFFSHRASGAKKKLAPSALLENERGERKNAPANNAWIVRVSEKLELVGALSKGALKLCTRIGNRGRLLSY